MAKVEELINSGKYSVTDTSPDGVTALHWAAINNRLTVCKYLLDKGAEVDAKGGELEATPLHWAARGGLVYIVHLLIQKGADPLRSDKQGFNALLLGVHSSNVLLVLYLLHQELPIDTMDPSGRTALHWAAYQGDALTVDALLNWGADTKIKDSLGFTALHWGIVRGNKSCLKRLIEEGSDLTAVSNDGKTCQIMAQEMSNVHSWLTALKEAGRLPSGQLRTRHLSIKNAKLTVFFVPYIVVFIGIWLCSHINLLFAIPLTLLTAVGSLKLLKDYVIPDITTSHHPLLQTPFFAGVFSGSAFWTLIHYITHILPTTLFDATLTNFMFVVLFTSTIFCFFTSMFMDPGIVPKLNGISQQRKVIEDLIDRGEYDTRHFCISTYIRKPLRSKYDRILKRVVARYDHYCPWVNNVVGLRNHKRFLLFVISLAFGIALFLYLFYIYVNKLSSLNESETCTGSFTYFCEGFQIDSFGMIICFWVFIQLIWVFFLLFVQLVQVSRAITTNEASNLHRFGFMGADDFSSLPADHSSNSNNVSHAHTHSHAKKRWWTPLFRLLGIDQFISTAQDTMASKRLRDNWRASNPADHGIYRNCMDFWFPNKIMNVYKAEPGGRASLGNVTVDYYSLWDFPAQRNGNYEQIENV